jgi:hypothetical protein
MEQFLPQPGLLTGLTPHAIIITNRLSVLVENPRFCLTLLKTMARFMAIEPEGTYHRALTDARMEAKIVQRAFADLNGGVFIPNVRD